MANTAPVSIVKRQDQNRLMVERMLYVRNALDWLMCEGYTVLSVHIETRNPLIQIQSCKQCERLQGATKIRRNGSTGRETVMASLINFCQVEWVVR